MGNKRALIGQAQKTKVADLIKPIKPLGKEIEFGKGEVFETSKMTGWKVKKAKKYFPNIPIDEVYMLNIGTQSFMMYDTVFGDSVHYGSNFVVCRNDKKMCKKLKLPFDYAARYLSHDKQKLLISEEFTMESAHLFMSGELKASFTFNPNESVFFWPKDLPVPAGELVPL